MKLGKLFSRAPRRFGSKVANPGVKLGFLSQGAKPKMLPGSSKGFGYGSSNLGKPKAPRRLSNAGQQRLSGGMTSATRIQTKTYATRQQMRAAKPKAATGKFGSKVNNPGVKLGFLQNNARPKLSPGNSAGYGYGSSSLRTARRVGILGFRNRIS